MAARRAAHRANPEPRRWSAAALKSWAAGDPGPLADEAPTSRRLAQIALALALAIVVVVSLVQLTLKGADPSRAAAGASASGSAADTGSASPSSSESASPSASQLTPAQPAEQVAGQAERPTQLRLPDGTAVPVLAVGTRGGMLQVPDDIRNAGWWKGGAQIGDPFGAMLLAAHVDSTTQGLGPYAQLLSASPGDKVTVSSKGLRQVFELSSRRVISRESLPEQRSIFSPKGSPRLVMVTCTSPYIKSEGGYQNLAVLTAKPAGPVTRLQ